MKRLLKLPQGLPKVPLRLRRGAIAPKKACQDLPRMRPISVEQEVTEQFLRLGGWERLKFGVVVLNTKFPKEADIVWEHNHPLRAGTYPSADSLLGVVSTMRQPNLID